MRWTVPYIPSHLQVPHSEAQLSKLAQKQKQVIDRGGPACWAGPSGKGQHGFRRWLAASSRLLGGELPKCWPLPLEFPHIPNQPASEGPSRQFLPPSPAPWSHSLTPKRRIWVSKSKLRRTKSVGITPIISGKTSENGMMA